MYFITWNKNKLAEVQSIIHDVTQLDIELPEIQDVDAQKIIEAKLYEAKKHHPGNFFVEDTSLYLSALNWLPWPLIKWFLQELWQSWIWTKIILIWVISSIKKQFEFWNSHIIELIFNIFEDCKRNIGDSLFENWFEINEIWPFILLEILKQYASI